MNETKSASNDRDDRNMDRRNSVVIPVVEETAVVKTVEKETGSVVVHVTPSEREQQLSVPLAREAVEVERVAVDRFVDAPPTVRQEGDVTIVPVVEEVLVVEKRLRVKEEIRLTRRREIQRHEERVTLRSEEVQVLRSGESGTG